MSSAIDAEPPVTGRVDAQGRLVAADPPLAALNARAGGGEGGLLSVPQIATLARLARRLGITISRAAIAADGDRDINLWVRAQPAGDDVVLSITGWDLGDAPAGSPGTAADREADFHRAAADWTWESDDTLRLTALSGAAAASIGQLPAELVGRQLTRLFRFREGEDGALPILTALAERQRFEGQVVELISGGKARFLLSGVPLIDGMGRFAGFRGAAVSQRLEDEAAARRPPERPSAFSERLDEALRSPLAGIVESAERLRAQPEPPLGSDYAGYAADIAAAGRHLLSLVDDLVDLQAIERPDFAPAAEALDLADIVRRVAGLLGARAADRRVRLDIPGGADSLPAIGDSTRALQVLVNLIANAIRYSPEGGQVWIRLEREADRASVVVADQGKGIAAEDQARIFETFERVDPSEPGGTGLGLYIARRLARAMGGDISVDSAPGRGARFTFTLPTRKAR